MSCQRIFAYILLSLLPLFRMSPGFAVETTEQPDLQLPEVVITGEDKIKIKRMLEKSSFLFPEVIIPSPYGDRSRNLLKQGDRVYTTDKSQARTYYLEAIQVDPQNASAYLHLGDLDASQGNYALAAQSYKKALQAKPDFAEAHYKLGILYDKNIKNLELAISHYESYLQLGGKDPRVSYWLQRINTPQDRR